MNAINTEACTLREVTDKESRYSLADREKSSLSAFDSWALMQAFCKLLKNEENHNWWCWNGCSIEQTVYDNEMNYKRYELSLTEDGVLLLWMSTESKEYFKLWVVSMK